MKKAKYSHRDVVYLVVDPETKWMVTGLLAEIDSPIKYQISNGYQPKIVFECEMTDEAILPVKIKGLK